MRFLYSLSMLSYGLAIRMASLFNSKAKQWIAGRRHWQAAFSAENQGGVWMHCASAGEFEQGRPVLEALKDAFPEIPLTLTFFSPSGYEMRKNYGGVDAIGYLPLDVPSNARQIIGLIKPRLLILVKYEIWHNLIDQASRQAVPITLISAIFRPNQIYWKPWGSWFLKSLRSINPIFCQNEASQSLLQKHGLSQAKIAGDTRFDRVIELAKNPSELPEELLSWRGTSQVLVAGSTWAADENILRQFAADHPEIKILLVPHEIHEAHLAALERDWPSAIRWSNFRHVTSAQTIIIDRMGMLSSLYQLCDVAYIGGGFGAGIHNTLEAATFGKPILFGPNFAKFQEAQDLVRIGAAFAISGSEETKAVLENLFSDLKMKERTGKIAGDYVKAKSGATEKITNELRPRLIEIAAARSVQP